MLAHLYSTFLDNNGSAVVSMAAEVIFSGKVIVRSNKLDCGGALHVGDFGRFNLSQVSIKLQFEEMLNFKAYTVLTVFLRTV